MLLLNTRHYHTGFISPDTELPAEFAVLDHLYGFDICGNNTVLQSIQNLAVDRDCQYTVLTSYPNIPHENRYPNLTLKFKFFQGYDQLYDYKPTQELKIQNFVCSFNGGEHVSRKFLLASLHTRGWYHTNTVSKCFTWPKQQLLRQVEEYVGDKYNYYQHFFVNQHSNDFFASTNPIGSYIAENPKLKFASFVAESVQELETPITSSFVHIVSETLGTSYFPFVTEKFMYSVAMGGLFLAYAQPGWHQHLAQVWGFRLYNQLFDYSFDLEPNPVIRVIKLLDMLSRFEHLSTHDWHDLYLLESDTIKYNQDHYFSRDFKKQLGVEF